MRRFFILACLGCLCSTLSGPGSLLEEHHPAQGGVRGHKQVHRPIGELGRRKPQNVTQPEPEESPSNPLGALQSPAEGLPQGILWMGAQAVPHRQLSPSAVTRLFQRIEMRDVRRYFLLMRSYLQEDEDNKIILALDSTSISSYSTRLTHIEYGKNKDDDALPQLNVLFLVDQKSGLPIFYRFYDGNVPDVSTIRHTIADQALLNMKNVVLVADKGYNSVKNINDCLINKVEFIFNVRLGTKGCLARELIDEHRKEFADLNSGDPYIRKNIATAKVNWKYDPRPVEGKPASNSATAELYYHMFYDPVIYQEAANKLTESLLTIKKKLIEEEALSEQEEELKEKFFRNDKEKGLVIVNRRVDEYLKYKGFRVLVTDSEKDPVKAWTAYADRWRVEDAFATLKDRLGCNRIRCSNNKALQGKTFVQFIATGLSLMVRSRIRSYMKENKKAGKLNLVYESDSKILQVLNNVMQTRFNHGYYFDEVAGKKIKYFEALGVGVPGAGPETPEDVQEEPEAETLLGTDIEI